VPPYSLLSFGPGTLPPASSGYTDFFSINLEGTSITGLLPESWSLFPALQVIAMDDTNITCNLFYNGTEGLACQLPSWVELSLTTSSDVLDPAHASSIVLDGIHCPELEIKDRAFSSVVLPATFYSHVFCTCDPTFFGIDGQCMPCPQSCRCSGSVVQVSESSCGLAHQMSNLIRELLSLLLSCRDVIPSSSLDW
jgi:hypothetical protein